MATGEPASRVVHCTMIWLESLLRDRCPCRGSLGLASVTTGDSPASVRLLKPPRDALTLVKYLHGHGAHAGLGSLGKHGAAYHALPCQLEVAEATQRGAHMGGTPCRRRAGCVGLEAGHALTVIP